jgi:hypothetical protein
MTIGKKIRLAGPVCIILVTQIISNPAYADSTSAGVSQISGFIKSVIEVLAGLSGMVATGYFVVGGFSYITSAGNPQRLEKAKRTILYSAIGLAITIAAFVISNIVTSLASSAFGS